MFFLCVVIQGFLVQEIMMNNHDTLKKAIQLFYRFGWVGFALVFFFNSSFIALLIHDCVLSFKSQNRELMDKARRIYYYNKLNIYEKENEIAPLGLMNKWVRLGNLN
jgi:hypothetical protein